MRLLHTKTKCVEEFFGKDIPPYAILSHTWGPKEVTFKDIERDGYKGGSSKIDGCCVQAEKDGLEYIWIDTCCIDKSSSAELSEAINSMWSWYRMATACYAYLSDVPRGNDLEHENSAFRRSRWFTRGWTLQELLAPRKVSFYDESWVFLGRKGPSNEDELWGFLGRMDASDKDESLTTIISQITKIPSEFLKGNRNSSAASVAQKMRWAAGRTTTRIEDVAYSLLGIFGVSMTMLYGEGSQAFIRLQEEIIKSSDDESIFAWGFSQTPEEDYGVFARTPDSFANCGNLIPFTPTGIRSSHYSLTNKGLHIDMSIRDLSIVGGISFGRLNCSSLQERGSKSIVLPLIRSRKDENTFFRSAGCAPVLVSSSLFPESARSHVYLHMDSPDEGKRYSSGLTIDCRLAGENDRFMIREFYPPNWYTLLSLGGPFNLRESLGSQRQSILFLCEDEILPNFAVKIEYAFELGYFSLRPRQVEFWAAFMEKGMTLADLMIRNPDGREAVLDWRRSLDFGGKELTFRLWKRELPHDWFLNIEMSEKQGQSKERSTRIWGRSKFKH